MVESERDGVGLGVDSPRDCDVYWLTLHGEPPLPLLYRHETGSLLLSVLAGHALPEARMSWRDGLEQASSSPGSLVGVGASAHGALGVSHIAREAVNLCSASCNKGRAPDAVGEGDGQLERAHITQHCSLERGTLKM